METPIGTVFKSGAGVFWKITGEVQGYSYPVVRCNKNGKEFKDKNGFTKRYVDELEWKDGVKFTPKSNEKVSQAGIEGGKKKRRLRFLLNRIKSDMEESEMLGEELFTLNQKKD